MDIDLVSLMNGSESIIDLEAKINDEGYEFPNYLDYTAWLRSEFDKIQVDKLNQLLLGPPKETKFPTLGVEVEGVEYLLHGIGHGWPIYLAPGWQPRKKVVDYVSRTMKSFINPQNREDYFYEENLNQFFHLSKTEELKDITCLNGEKPFLNQLGMSLLSLPFAMLFSLLSPLLFGAAYLYTRTITKPSGRIEGFVYLAQKALTDSRFIGTMFEFYIAQELPQPFNLEMKYLDEKSSSLMKLPHSLTGNMNLITGSRSLWIADQLRSQSKKKQLKRLHYLCGTDHVTEIAYFLEHPDFSFERLEEYRKSRS